MEILYVTSVPSPDQFEVMKQRYKPTFVYGMAESGFKFHTLILNGLKEKDGVSITHLVGRSLSRRSHYGLYWKKLVEKTAPNLEYRHLALLNFPILKYLTAAWGFYRETRSWVRRNRGKELGVVMDASYVTAHPFVLWALRGVKCHKTAIFCDIYDYMGDVKDARNAERVSLPRRIMRKVARSSYAQLDSMILLTEQMTDVVNPWGKPFIVMEGLVDVNMRQEENLPENKDDHDSIMYAGALRAQYGLESLVKGFMKYDNSDARLWIFGAGDYAPEIEQAAQKDSRILFYGMQPQAQVVQRELSARVLVNARPTGMEFSQYSFPSKNMEYMVSGTPVLTTRLPGMPKEYEQYVYTIDGDTPEDVTAALEKVFSETRDALHQKGMESKNFVLQKKNNLVQTQRMLSLLRGNSGERTKE